LVELLVVIAIIAVLASAGFAVAQGALNRAKRLTCQNQATGIEQAVNGFVTDYGAMPKDGSTDTTVETDKDNTLLLVLLGMEGDSGTVLNTRGVKYLTAKEGKKQGTKGINGLIYNANGSSVTGLYDPWGGGYNVILDLDFDEKVQPQPSAGGTLKTLNGKRVAVWSDGADGVNGGGKAADDVKTWQ
jgi:type II secretory pathway pseudopilin PulG